MVLVLHFSLDSHQTFIGRTQRFVTSTGIPRFTQLMWGQNKKTGEAKPRKSRLVISTKGEENRIEL